MSLAVVLSAVLQEKHKPETVAVDIPLVHNVRCSLQLAQLVAKKPQFLSNLQVTSRFIAAIATNHVPETTGKIVCWTLPGLTRGGFLLFLIILIKEDYNDKH